jgi:hypothetical protein
VRHIPTWKKKERPCLKNGQAYFKEAQKFWDNLPDYAKYLWENGPRTQYYATKNSPWRAQVKGRTFFFREAIQSFKRGLRPHMTPYDKIKACIVWQVEPQIFYTE